MGIILDYSALAQLRYIIITYLCHYISLLLNICAYVFFSKLKTVLSSCRTLFYCHSSMGKTFSSQQKVPTIFNNGRWEIVHITVDTHGFTSTVLRHGRSLHLGGTRHSQVSNKQKHKLRCMYSGGLQSENTPLCRKELNTIEMRLDNLREKYLFSIIKLSKRCIVCK